MKNRIVIAAFVCVSFFSCKKAETPDVETTTTTTTTETETTPAPETSSVECYQYAKGKDTINANLAIKGGVVSGDLAYKFFEKDKSSGPVVGTISGDTIIVEYSFQSEGMQSVREVAFLRKNNRLTEGYADIEEKGGKVIFKDRKKLMFNGTVLNKIPCN